MLLRHDPLVKHVIPQQYRAAEAWQAKASGCKQAEAFSKPMHNAASTVRLDSVVHVN